MNEKELKNLTGKGESQKIEFKQKPSEDIGKPICSFANTNDGIILVGISDKKEIIGCNKKHEQQISNIAHTCKPAIYPKIEEIKIGNKTIFIVKVKKTGSIHSYKNVAYKRIGAHDKPLSPEEVIEFAKDSGRIRWDGQICEGASYDDINKEKVKSFLRKAKAERNFDINPETPVKEAFERLRLIKDGKLTNASVLLFGKNPQKFFLQARIRCARFKGTTAVDFIDMKIIEDNIIDQVDDAERFILSHIKKAAKIVMFKREEAWEYPPDALREAIVNAVCHRDYESTGNIKIAVFDDRVEITDPGKLPEPLTPKMLKQNHESVPRNKLIANVFFLIRNIEQWGKGTNKIVQWCVEHGLKEPDFKEIGGGFLVKFHAPKDLLSLIPEKGKVDLKELGLNKRQIEALRLMINDRKVFTNRAYREKFNVSNKTAATDLNQLVELGEIASKGKGRNVEYHYMIKQKTTQLATRLEKRSGKKMKKDKIMD